MAYKIFIFLKVYNKYNTVINKLENVVIIIIFFLKQPCETEGQVNIICLNYKSKKYYLIKFKNISLLQNIVLCKLQVTKVKL